MAWEAPPYPRNNRQIVCASTQYRDDQPLWLFHSSAVAGFPFVGRLFGDWSRTPDAAGADPDDAFREFHRSRPVDPDVAPWNNLANWHDTSEWLANRPSYELVVGAFRRPDPSALRCGAAAGAGSAAATHVVVPFTTYAPFGQNELRVAVFERKGTPQGSPMWLEMAVEEDDGHGGDAVSSATMPFLVVALSAFLTSPALVSRTALVRTVSIFLIGSNLLFLLQYQFFMRGFQDIVPEYPEDLWTVFGERFVMPFKLVAAWLNS